MSRCRSTLRNVNVVLISAVVLFATALAGCAKDPVAVEAWKMAGARSDSNSSKSTQSQPISTGAEDTGPAMEEAARYPGSGRFFETESRTNIPLVEDSDGDGYNLNFSDTDLRTVMQAVVGDILGLPYFIDPGIHETISLQTSRKIGKEGLLGILETVLRIKGMAMVSVDGVLNVVPLSEAPRRTTPVGEELPESHGRPGFGVQVVPIQYTTPTQLRRLLEPFSPKGGIVSADDSRNILIIAGTRQEIRGMLETIETFDVDWLAGMSYALFKVKYVEAETLSKELLNIFGDPQSPIAGIVRLVPIPRLNAILAISSRDQYLSDVQAWIERLDVGGGSSGRKIYVYNVKNGRAADLATAMGRILGDTRGGSTETTATEQSSQTSASSSADMLQRQTTPSLRPFGSTGLTESQPDTPAPKRSDTKTSTPPLGVRSGRLADRANRGEQLLVNHGKPQRIQYH